MSWELFTVDKKGGKSTPFVSIGRGNLNFSALACELVEDRGQYKYAQIYTQNEKGKRVAAVKFLEDYQENSIRIKRKSDKDGRTIPGMTITHKGAVKDLFGKDGSNDGTIRKNVEKVAPDMLKIID